MIFQTEFDVFEILDWTLPQGETVQDHMEELAVVKIIKENDHINFDRVTLYDPNFEVDDHYVVVTFQGRLK